jgi:tRNA pseudouridine32 synthase/23S rRNA pseudouridine746 synthase
MVDAAAMLFERVLFIDAEAIVVDKPAGCPWDAPRDGSLSEANHLETLAFGFRRWPQPVHRLDRDTSGCLLLSRNPKAHARFQQAFEARQVENSTGRCWTAFPKRRQAWSTRPLRKVSTREEGWRMIVDPRGKPARTGWRVLAVPAAARWWKLKPETGRTHQFACTRRRASACRSRATRCTGAARRRGGLACCCTPAACASRAGTSRRWRPPRLRRHHSAPPGSMFDLPEQALTERFLPPAGRRAERQQGRHRRAAARRTDAAGPGARRLPPPARAGRGVGWARTARC